jgi:hypothetical protein
MQLQMQMLIFRNDMKPVGRIFLRSGLEVLVKQAGQPKPLVWRLEKWCRSLVLLTVNDKLLLCSSRFALARVKR